jgi:hypothetical protein
VLWVTSLELNKMNSTCQGVVSEKFDVAVAVVLPAVMLAFILLPFIKCRGKRLRVLKPSIRTTLAENEALMKKELLLAAVLISVASVYGLVVSIVNLVTGSSIGIDASTIVAIVASAWVSSFGALDSTGKFSALRDAPIDNPANASAQFFLEPLAVYEKLKLVADSVSVFASVMLIVAVVLSRNPKREYTSRQLGFVAWIITVISNVFPLLV